MRKGEAVKAEEALASPGECTPGMAQATSAVSGVAGKEDAGAEHSALLPVQQEAETWRS